MKNDSQSPSAETYWQLAFGTPKLAEDEDLPRGLRGLLRPAFSSDEHLYGYRHKAAAWLAVVIAGLGVVPLMLFVTILLLMFIGVSGSGEASASTRETAAVISGVVLVGTIFVLISLFYLIAFAGRSYRINKHLEVVYTHRWALQKSIDENLAHVVSDADRGKTAEQMMAFFYQNIETGYVTKKDGLGDSSVVPASSIAKVASRR